jgi:RNA polymerase sigma-70 factor (ECF subfamily)
MLDDERLFADVVSGSREAFEQLYERFYARAYRIAWAVCRDDGRAEDAVQEAFIAILRSPGSYRPERGAVAAWLLSLVRYRAIDVARANTTHASRRADEDEGHTRSVPGILADQVINRDSAAKLKARLRLLPAAQREVVTLAFFDQLSHAEIAAKLQLPPGTVKGRMRLGLQRLRVSLDEAHVSERFGALLVVALRNGDLGRARRVVVEASEQMPVVTMLDDVLAPAMHRIGMMWQAAALTVADEHVATAICRQLVGEISTTLQTAPANSRETVLLVTPESERHELGLLMAAAVLYGAGYDTLFLGSSVPAAALNAALLRYRPAVVAMSSSMPRPASLVAAANLIHETLPTAQLITGGSTARQLPANIAAHYVERLDGLLAAVDLTLAPSRPYGGPQRSSGSQREVVRAGVREVDKRAASRRFRRPDPCVYFEVPVEGR